MHRRKKLYIINGFLGSGKTTAIIRAATRLMQQGIKTGVITNDQGDQLVDTRYLNSKNIPTQQVVNGCFCCNYTDLLQSIQNLDEAYLTRIFFAESVGSCTDLVATIVKPMAAAGINIQPVITIVADGTMLPSMLNAGMLFDKAVVYIYKKQLEEADLILITKKDLLSSHKLESIIQQLNKLYPGKPCIAVGSGSAGDDSDDRPIDEWLQLLENFRSGQRHSLTIDYDTYAEGEAVLAWFDLEINLVSAANNAGILSCELANEIFKAIRLRNLQIGHLKFYLSPESGPVKISFTAGSETLYAPPVAIGNSLSEKMLINARVQTSPFNLSDIITKVFLNFENDHECRVEAGIPRSFKPGYPKPVHRIS